MLGKDPSAPAGRLPRLRTKRDLRATRARWVAAVIIAASAAAVSLGTYLFPAMRVCRDEAAAGAPGARVAICGPVGAADLPMLVLVALVVVLILLPDVRELGVPGLMTLKMDEDRWASPPSLASEGGKPSPARQVTEAEVRRLEGGAAEPASRGLTLATTEVDAERAKLEVQLLRLWEQLAVYVSIAEGARKGSWIWARVDFDLTAAERGAVEAWGRRLQGPLWAIRNARNTVAHAPGNITTEEIREAIAVAEKALSALFEVFERVRQPDG